MIVARSEQAKNDTLDIALHISNDSIVAAERFLDQVEMAIRQLQQFPISGPQIALPQFRALRCLAVPKFPKYFLFYVGNDSDAPIARVGDSTRESAAILDRSP